jgi:DUF3108-like
MRLLFTTVFLVTVALFSGPAANAACDHPYWALMKGVTRHYKSSNGHESNWKVERVAGDKATVVIAWMSDKNEPAKESQMEVECTGEGISLDFTKLGEDREGVEVKVVKHSGAFLPPAAKLKADYIWDTTETIEMTGPRRTKPLIFDISTRHKVEGTESVTVPAGTFEAVKITANNEMTMQIPQIKGRDGNQRAATMPGMTTHTTSTYWLVKDVGMVKAESKAEMGGMGSPGMSGAGMGARGGAPAMSSTTTTELTEYSK